jgi:hypothetical protein
MDPLDPRGWHVVWRIGRDRHRRGVPEFPLAPSVAAPGELTGYCLVASRLSAFVLSATLARHRRTINLRSHVQKGNRYETFNGTPLLALNGQRVAMVSTSWRGCNYWNDWLLKPVGGGQRPQWRC